LIELSGREGRFYQINVLNDAVPHIFVFSGVGNFPILFLFLQSDIAFTDYEKTPVSCSASCTDLLRNGFPADCLHIIPSDEPSQ
jgi:hypothetical protein